MHDQTQAFETPGPIRLRTELHAGDLRVETADVTRTTVRLDGDTDAVARTRVEQHGDEVVVIVPRQSGGFLRRSPQVDAHVVLPHDSSIDCQLDAGDLTHTGRLRDLRVRTGSGDITVDRVAGLTQVATGSGDVYVARADGSTDLATGSGDLRVRTAGAGLDLKTGSGDVRVDDAHADVSAKTGSGDITLHRVASGRASAQTASGDVRVGVADGVAAWLDVHSLTGSVDSQLGDSAPPAEGDPTVEVRINTVTGDISLLRA